MKDDYGIAVYEIDRAYGGPEEGGWWYDTGELVHSESGMSKEAAIERAQELVRGEYRDTGNVYSVNYQGGAYSAVITKAGEEVPQHYPEETPHYE